MIVRIVCYELGKDNWILSKFAFKLHENLQILGIQSEVAATPSEDVDINHHIIYYDFDGIKRGIETLMITHIDNEDKLLRLKKQMDVADAGICMSKETVQYLSQMGCNKNGLCYVNPAHDNVMPVKKHVIGISCRVQEDGRKREYFLDRLAGKLNPNFFSFKIMGAFWQPQVENLRKHGFEVEYFDDFNYEEYVKLIPGLDYYLYMGMDEGQMGFVDALAAGVKTIVTHQGYHLDAVNGITHPFTTYEELEKILFLLQQEKQQLVESVSTWNWLDYTKKHVEIWNYFLNQDNGKSSFSDGLNSLLQSRNEDLVANEEFVKRKRNELKKAQYSHLFFKNKRQFKTSYQSHGMNGVFRLIGKKISNKLRLR
jgi:hypothetical protein